MKNLKIKNKKPIQENFLGFNAVYHGYATLTDTLPPYSVVAYTSKLR